MAATNPPRRAETVESTADDANLTVPGRIFANPPATAIVNEPTPTYPVEVDMTVPSEVTEVFSLVGAETLSGTEQLDEEIVDGPDDIDTAVSLDVPTTDIPASGTFTMGGSGAAPSERLTVAGSATIEVGALSFTLTPRDEEGRTTELGTFDETCTLKEGQNATLATITVDN